MKHFTFLELDLSRFKSISGPLEVVGGSRPRLTLIHRDNNQKFFFKTYTHNPREVWAECLASHIAGLVNISAQAVTIKKAPPGLENAMKERYGTVLPENWKPIGTLSRNIFPKDVEITYGSVILGTPSSPMALEQIELKFREKYYAPEDLLQSFADMLVFDALIGNMDRHHENWGICEHERYKQQVLIDKRQLINLRWFTPLFDHGSSLMFELSDGNVSAMLNSSERLEQYVARTKFGYVLDSSGNKVNPLELFNNHILSNTSWKARLLISLEKISKLDTLLLAELIIQMPGAEALEYSADRRSVLFKAILMRYNLLIKLLG